MTTPARPDHSRRRFRSALLAGASFAALAVGSTSVEAGSLRDRNTSAAAASAVAAAQAGAQQAAAAASQSMVRANASLRAMRDAQAAARAAARAGASMVPNGLAPGGLVVAPGAVPSATDGGAGLWQGAGLPTQSNGANGRVQVEVRQTHQKAILTWSSFNVGRETDLYFNQTAGGSQAANWIALNRVLDPSGSPTRILGSIRAEGQVYVINRNGIIFGGASQVNVGTLVASALEIGLTGVNGAAYGTDSQANLAQRNQRFLAGLLSFTDTTNMPIAFGEDLPSAQRVSTTETFPQYDGVTVEAGAQIRVGNYGQALLMGHNVINRGSIEAPDGQVLMVAGRGIVLNRSGVPDVRGYLVGVERGGLVENTGLISAARGNVTLSGKDITQAGVLTATTGVEANGSIVLKAVEGTSRQALVSFDGITVESGYVGAPNTIQQRGTVTFARDSVTAVFPDDSGQISVGAGSYRRSVLDVYANKVLLLDNSTVYLPAGRIGFWTGKQINQTTQPDTSRVYIGDGARIDVAGLRDIVLPMDQHQIEAELRANELRDNPLLRNSGLRGKKVYFDARLGISIADVSGNYDLIERDVGQMMTSGGTIALRGMEIVARQGSVIDISGGSVRYLDGYVRSTVLVDAAGRRVRIEDAVPGVLYVGFAGDKVINHARWGITETYTSRLRRADMVRFEPGYLEGRSAGTLDLDVALASGASALARDAFRIFDGEVQAGVVVGEHQNEASTGATFADVTRVWRETPRAGALLMGGVRALGANDPGYIGGDITIATNGPRLASDFRHDTAFDYANAYDHVLPTRWFDGQTFGSVTLRSGYTSAGAYDANTDSYGPGPYAAAGHLTIAEGVTVNLGSFGSFSFYGRQADIGGTVRAPGGSIKIEAVLSPSSQSTSPTQNFNDIPEAERPAIHLRDTAVLDVAGLWINDHLDGIRTMPRAIDGGKVELVSYNLSAEQGSLIDVSGGGHLDTTGRRLTPGDGGSIVIDTSVRYTMANPAESGPGNGRLALDGTLRGFALGRGATLTIDTADDVFISNQPVLETGVLPAGMPAPRELRLASDTVLPAGSYLPISFTYKLARVEAGQTLPASVSATGISAATPLALGAAWALPDGVQVRGDNNVVYRGVRGDVVPAGVKITTWSGSLPAGYVLPASVFSQGLAIVPVTLTQAPGVLTRNVVVPAHTVIPEGVSFGQQVQFVPPRTFAPEFFTKGGFSGFAISGARGMTITGGTVIAPSFETLVLDNPALIATGTHLADVAGRLVLPAEQRGPMTLSLSTSPVDISSGAPVARIFPAGAASRYPGKLIMEDGAQIVMTPESLVRLAAPAGMFVDGSISAQGGTIELLSPTVRIGGHARLLVPGYVDVAPDGGETRRSVEAAGRIVIAAERSASSSSPWTPSTTLMIDANAVLDASGIQGVTDTNAGGVPSLSRRSSSPNQAVTVDGSAGTIEIHATYGVLGGHYRLAPGGATGRGGTLIISTSIDRTSDPGIVVRQGVLPGSVTQDSAIPTLPGLVVVADRINASGLDDLVLATVAYGNTDVLGVRFDGDVTLTSRRSMALLTPLIGTVGARPASVELASSYILLGPETTNAPNAPATAGTVNGHLTVRADLIDLQSRLVLGCASGACAGVRGFDTARFVATGDIRLHAGRYGSASSPAGLFSSGALAFDAAQVYVTARIGADRPDTDPGFLVQSARSVTFTSNGNAAPVPYSFGERLTVRAPVIVQGGVVRAPLGQIRLEASQSLTLLPGSLTSASLEGLVVPYGFINAAGVLPDYDIAGEAPTKSVRLDSPNVAVRDGAVIDVSGGGDLLAWSFSPGNGGSTDILAYDAASPRFAVVPSFGASPMPRQVFAATSNPTGPHNDQNVLHDPRLRVGDTVWLEAVPGLAAGYYTLLPARYALLPGGMLVEPMGGGHAAAVRSAAMPDGAVIASGYRAVAGLPIRDQNRSLFKVMNANAFTQYSDLKTYSFNSIASNLAADAGGFVRTPFDAGTVILAATQSLVFDGIGRFGAPAGGLSGNLDIAAARIAVVTPDETAPAGYLRLDARMLAEIGAGSVLIGGTRATGAAGTTIRVIATDVIVDNDASAPLSGSELILAATSGVTVTDRAVIVASGDTIEDAGTLLLSGDGALLRVSTGDRVGIVRSGNGHAAGDLTIADGARLTATGSLTLDASRALAIAPRAILEARQLDLASDQINLGDVPAGTAGTTLGLDTIERLAASSDLLLRGHTSIHLFGGFTLGHRGADGIAAIRRLSLDSGRIEGHAGAGGPTTIVAGELVLRNSGPAAASPATGGAGSLVLDVDTLALGPGPVKLAGYGALQGTAATIVTTGTGAFETGGNLSLATALVTSATNSDYAVRTGGSLTLAALGRTADRPATLGGRLALQAGTDLQLTATIVVPAGVVEMTAGGSMNLGATAMIDVSGAAVDVFDVVRFAPGGTIRLDAAGALDLAAGAVLDISGAARGGDAGSIALTAGGTATVGAALRGGAAAGHRGSSFALDAGRLSSFSALNALLNDGGFDRSRTIRLRQQDIVVHARERIRAHQLVLQADTGSVTVAGTIDAAGDAVTPDGGRIVLTGGNGVALTATAVLDARAGQTAAGGFDPAGGTVELTATGGRLDMAPGASIDVGGGSRGGGEVIVRAPRSGNDVAIDRLAGSVIGARVLEIDGLATYTATTVDATLRDTMLSEASSWLANAAAIRARLGRSDFDVRPGMVVTSAGDLTVGVDIDLSGLGGAGYLGFVSGGNLAVNATIGDGFASGARNAALLAGPSFSYGFDSAGSITLAANAMIRTGSGDIAIAAGDDLLLTAQNSVIYTAGRKTATAAGFNPALLGGTAVVGEFATDGGDIRIAAGRDVLAPLTTQTTSAWLFRYGDAEWNGDPNTSNVVQQTSWSVVYKNFEQGLGALGGGNVTVAAGRDIKDLAVAIPTTGHLTTGVGTVARASDLHVRGGGDLSVAAGRDLLGGVFMLGRGDADIVAGRSVTASGDTAKLRNAVQATTFADRPVSLLLGLMDASARVTAISGVTIGAAFDPALQAQIAENLISGTKGSGFHSYTQRTALEATAIGGATSYLNDPWSAIDVSRPNANAAYQVKATTTTADGLGRPFLLDLYGRAPGTLALTALSSNVLMTPRFGNGLTMAAAADGTLELVARGDVRITPLLMDDVAIDYYRGPLVAFATTRNTTGENRIEIVENRPLFGATAANNFLRGFTPLHAEDREPVRIYALDGSICGTAGASACVPSTVSSPVFVNMRFPKAVALSAGRDIMHLELAVQHNQPDAWSTIAAGRNILTPVVNVTGGGTLLLEAGRSIDFGPHGRVVTADGGTTNLALPRGRAADIVMMAGTANGADFGAFAAAYLDPENREGVVRTYLQELATFMTGLGHGNLSGRELVAAFEALAPTTRQAFLLKVYFNELKETGIDYNDAASARHRNYDRGYRAVATLFPTDPQIVAKEGTMSGDIILNARQVETQARGDIMIVAPYGRVEVGIEFPEPNYSANSGGVVTRRGGDVRIMADQDIALFTSRVFTLQGGDITMWSSNGDITAGSGAKTSVRQVPLTYTMSNDGVIDLNVFGLQTGAGIGVLDALGAVRDPNLDRAARRRGRIDLIAFRGEVNAGDAGIRVIGGDLNIAALRIVGADNILVVGGTTTGVPVAPPASTPTLMSDTSSKTTADAVRDMTQVGTQERPSVIIVEILGYGGDGERSPQRDEDEPGRERRTYNERSPFQVVGAGTINERGERVLTADEKEAFARR